MEVVRNRHSYVLWFKSWPQLEIPLYTPPLSIFLVVLKVGAVVTLDAYPLQHFAFDRV